MDHKNRFAALAIAAALTAGTIVPGIAETSVKQSLIEQVRTVPNRQWA